MFEGELNKLTAELEDQLVEINSYLEAKMDKKRAGGAIEDTFNITFEKMLEELNLTEEKYVLSIQSKLEKATIFLSRKPVDIRTNPFNMHLIEVCCLLFNCHFGQRICFSH